MEVLNRTAAADKVLGDKAFNIAKNLKYDGCQCELASMVYKFFHERIQLQQQKMKIFLMKNQLKNYRNQLLENLRKEKYNHLL